MERLSTVIVSDKDKVGLREHLKEQIERNPSLHVVKLSRLKISRIRGEIAKNKPNLILVLASLNKVEEYPELRGFISKVRRNLPETFIVVSSPLLEEKQLQEVYSVGANAWIDERMAYEYWGDALESTTTGKQFLHPMFKKK